MWRSNTVSRRVNSIGCRRWRPIWFVVSWPSLWHRQGLGRHRQGRDFYNFGRLHRWHRPGPTGPRRQPQPIRRRHHWHQHHEYGGARTLSTLEIFPTLLLESNIASNGKAVISS